MILHKTCWNIFLTSRMTRMSSFGLHQKFTRAILPPVAPNKLIPKLPGKNPWFPKLETLLLKLQFLSCFLNHAFFGGTSVSGGRNHRFPPLRKGSFRLEKHFFWMELYSLFLAKKMAGRVGCPQVSTQLFLDGKQTSETWVTNMVPGSTPGATMNSS